MKYFLLNQHPYFKGDFRLNHWKEMINPAWISPGEFYKIPRSCVITVDMDETTAFPDLIITPFLLFSKLLLDVANMYGEAFYRRDIVLVNPKEHESRPYSLILLDTIKPESTLWKVKNLFFLDIEQRRELIASQDFIESILRRGAKGIEIKEFTLLTGEDER